ncbi:ribose ABC transporter, substrate-binding protein [Rhodococcus sp. B7740]|uniref:sugar ABC transporter substrate-binding protein n=1 Tax=Rhodococcus sp. B7740 TaxID=1564114 RepID=UPI0005DA5A08|nr:sugar ABC transporter substrate-binding protein [Rhodococcus sp. B7740]AJW43248.1 ribose ABC transporter, substrate-binding protein [Rhodococcus sp. B7740]
MKLTTYTLRMLTLLPVAALIAGCSVGGFETVSSSEPRPDWCGPNEAVIGFADGSGGNSWKRTNFAELQDELAKCSSVTDFITTDAQGDTQKAIADIKSSALRASTACWCSPTQDNDSSGAALRIQGRCRRRSLPISPVDPRARVHHVRGRRLRRDRPVVRRVAGEIAAERGRQCPVPRRTARELPGSRGVRRHAGILVDHPGIKLIGDQPFTVTNWTPAETQQATSTMLSRFPQIDAVMTDFAATSIMTAFQQAGRPLPLIASGRLQRTVLPVRAAQGRQSRVRVVHGHLADLHGAPRRPARRSRSNRGIAPESKVDVPVAFEDSISAEPSAPICNPALPEDALLSSTLDPQRIGEVLQ